MQILYVPCFYPAVPDELDEEVASLSVQDPFLFASGQRSRGSSPVPRSGTKTFTITTVFLIPVATSVYPPPCIYMRS